VNRIVHRIKASVVGIALASTLVGVGGVIAVGTAIAASQTMVATVTVNVRSGPGANYPIIGYVDAGGTVTATGGAVSGQSSVGSTWTPVTHNGKSGYVATIYLKSSGSDSGSGTTTAATGGAVTNTSVNVRTGPGTSYSIVTQLASGTAVQTTGVTSGSWTQISYQGADRWLFSAYITVGGSSSSSSTYGQVRTTANLYLRAEGYLGATILGTLPADSIVDVTGETTDAYTQILYQGLTAWIASKYTVAATSVPIVYSTGSSSGLSSAQQTLVNYVKSKVGDAYVWGAAGPNSFDCSGLTMMAYQQVGISLPHHAADQATLGTAVSRANLKAGDLIFWSSPVSHVSMYIGNGMMVHARNTTVGVVEQSVDSYINMGGSYTGARHFVN
jgi:peptidoglycan DL-endopeptidase CwlO